MTTIAARTRTLRVLASRESAHEKTRDFTEPSVSRSTNVCVNEEQLDNDARTSVTRS